MNWSVLAGVALSVCLAAGPVRARQTAADGDENTGPGSATVKATPDPEGNLGISVFLTGVAARPNLSALARNALQCDWRTTYQSPTYATGVCRRLLKSDGHSVTGWIALAPLGAALHRIGAADVQFELESSGHPQDSRGPQWRPRTVASPAANSGKPRVSQYFLSSSESDLPPPFVVETGTPWQPNRLAVPFLLVFFGPALLAFWLRRRMARKRVMGSGVAWLNWVLLTCWLYWISAVYVGDLSAFVAAAGVRSPLATLFIAAAVYCLPLQVAIASCVAALASTARGERWRTVRQSLVHESALLVPLALVLAGTGLLDRDWRVALFGWLAAFGAYKGITWMAWRWSFADLFILEDGELRERASLIGSLAGVELRNVYVLGSRIPREANAFALAGGNLILTRSLLNHLTRRETDNVMAHEMGHLAGQHLSLRSVMFWAYFLALGPAVAVLVGKVGLPPAVTVIPFAPLVYVIVAARISRRLEFNADSRAVRLTGDPQGMIAALARLARFTRLPIDWGGVQGSVLSYPPMGKRALAIASAFGVPEARALAILENPDVLEAGSLPLPAAKAAGETAGPAAVQTALAVELEPETRHYAVPSGIEDEQAAFTTSAKVSHSHWAAWVSNGTLLGALLALAYLASRFDRAAPWNRLIIPLSLPAVACIYLWTTERWQCRFLARMKHRIAPRIPNAPAGLFVALLPGETVAPADGFYAWDLGFVFLDAQRLTYCGERTRFSVPRADVQAIEIRKGPLAWGRVHAVLVRTAAGSFNLHTADHGGSRYQARRLHRRLTEWWNAGIDAAESPIAPEYSAPQLPELPHAAGSSRWELAWDYLKQTALLFAGGVLLVALLPLLETGSATAMVPFAAPLIYLIVAFPGLIRKNT